MKKLSNYSILLFLIFFGCFTNYGNVKSSEGKNIIHTEAYPNGNLKEATTFTNHQGSMVIIGEETFFENGKTRMEKLYFIKHQGNVVITSEKTYFENGKLRLSKSYDMDGKLNQLLELDENGKTINMLVS